MPSAIVARSRAEVGSRKSRDTMSPTKMGNSLPRSLGEEDSNPARSWAVTPKLLATAWKKLALLFLPSNLAGSAIERCEDSQIEPDGVARDREGHRVTIFKCACRAEVEPRAVAPASGHRVQPIARVQEMSSSAPITKRRGCAAIRAANESSCSRRALQSCAVNTFGLIDRPSSASAVWSAA